MLRKFKLKYIAICFSCWVIGFILTFDFKHLLVPNKAIVIQPTLSAFIIIRDIIEVFVHNLIVGLLMSLVGYFSFGLAALAICVWNGVMIALCFNILLLQFTKEQLLIYFIHSPIEVLTLCCFGSLGLQGFSNLIRVYNNESWDFKTLPRFSSIFYLTISLAIAAIIEVLVPEIFIK